MATPAHFRDQPVAGHRKGLSRVTMPDMRILFHRLVEVLAGSSESALRQQVQYLKRVGMVLHRSLLTGGSVSFWPTLAIAGARLDLNLRPLPCRVTTIIAE